MDRTIRFATDNWVFHTWRECSEHSGQHRFRDNASAVHWLASFKSDPLAITAIRGLLAESEPAASSRSMTEATTVAHFARLLAAGHWHAHLSPRPPQTSKAAAALAPAPVLAAAHTKSGASSPTVAAGHLIVRVRTPLDAPIQGVTIEVTGRGHLSTGSDGRADFGQVPAASYNITAHKTDYGPLPTGASPFAIGNVTATQAVPAGGTVTTEMRMVTVTSVRVSHTPVVAATPLRIYKQARADTDVDHVITCIALCPRTTGTGAGTQFSVRVDWTFTAQGGNAPKAKGGKNDTDLHFHGVIGGSAMSGGGTTTASTVTDNAGVTQITFRASVTSGDHFVVHAKVLRDPANVAAGALGHDDSPTFEVWKKLQYGNLYRMQTGANAGFDLAPRCTVPNIQPAYTPAFTEYSVGPQQPLAYQEYITDLVVPTAAQLPLNGKVRVRSDDADTRVVTIHGLVVAADGSASAGSEVLTLNGTTNVVGATDFQKIAQVTVPALAHRTLSVETSAGVAVASIAGGHASASPNFLFDTVAAVQVKAQAWYDANKAKIGVDLVALRTSTGAVGFFMIGAAYYHPKHDGRATTGATTYYAGYPSLLIHYYAISFHPDHQWYSVDGVDQGEISCLFLNIAGGAYASMVARHEIGHASDHVSYGTGDHCPQQSCLMYYSSRQNTFCSIGADHSVRRTEGWLP